MASGAALAQALPFDWQNEVPDANDDFTRCMNRDRANADRTIQSCGRVIAERAGSEFTGAAYYSRGLMREILQDREQARGDFENAYTYFTIAIGSRDRHTDTYRNRAAALYRLGRFDEAIADYRSALAVVTNAHSDRGTRVRSGVADLRPRQVSSLHYRIGGVQFRAGRWSEAIAAFDQAAELEPESSSYQSARCEARAAADVDLDVAQAACERAIQLSEGSDEAIFSVGLFYFLSRSASGILDRVRTRQRELPRTVRAWRDFDSTRPRRRGHRRRASHSATRCERCRLLPTGGTSGRPLAR